jgi:phosphoserine phosphatase
MASMLVVLDVDSTLIEQEAIELLADEAGSGAQVAAVTARAMAGELDFATSLAERAATLAGLDEAVFTRVAPRITLTPGARELVAGVQAAGGCVAVVSGGFHELLDPVAADLGLDAHRANRLELADARLTGRTTGPVIDAAAKAAALHEWAQRFGVPLSRTVAVGDGANDLAMMAAAGLSIAFDAKPVVRAQAHVSLPQRDLAAVLAVLGLRG